MLVKVIVIYESKYGNTKQVAEKIAEGIREAEGVEVALREIKDVDEIFNYDVVLIGSPNHFGGPTSGVKKFIDKFGKLSLKGNSFAVFDTYIRGDSEKAVKKMEKRINEKIPESKLLTAGLSIKVQGIKGPVPEEELSRCMEFGNKVATKLRI